MSHFLRVTPPFTGKHNMQSMVIETCLFGSHFIGKGQNGSIFKTIGKMIRFKLLYKIRFKKNMFIHCEVDRFPIFKDFPNG